MENDDQISIDDETHDIEYVPTSYYDRDEIEEYIEDGITKTREKYVIYTFGRMENGESITIKVDDYHPSFSIRIPNEWKQNECSTAITYLKQAYVTRIRNGANDSDIVSVTVEKYHDLYEHFCANKKFKYMKFHFVSQNAHNRFKRVFRNRIKIPNIMNTFEIFDTYEYKLHSILAFIIDTNINSANWNLVKNGEQLDDSLTTTDWYYRSSYKNFSPILEERNLPPIRVTSYDIECISADGTFPQPDRVGDKIVSICATTNIYGSETIVRTDVLSLGSTKSIEGANVKSFNTQKELLLAWRDTIKEIDTDIIIGFNIFGFDNTYNRVKSLQPDVNCGKGFSKMSRLINHECEFKNHRMSSSGTGDNSMDFFVQPGREEFDIMKLIQQEMALTQYSLDKCAEEIMKTSVTVDWYVENELYRVKTNTNDVKVGDYLKFDIGGFISQKKHKVVKSIKKGNDRFLIVSVVKGVNAISAKKITLAKDDLSPNEITSNFHKGPAERRIIHKYCIQDCALVNKLCHRKDFVTQKMALANVAGVPLNYIILKGQGIKTLSLFTKFCRSIGYIIKDLIPDEGSGGGKLGYEGAIVIEPIKDFYERPLTTLDFNSLYPSSEISYDMSHETLVKDPQYLNLPDYHYREVPFDEMIGGEKTGKVITAIFATKKENVDSKGSQIPGKHGIVGSILTKLLTDRKIAKKKKKLFPDKANIYENQQKALKVTANSVYGQLGSGVSQVGCPIIAAATTAVGRMLLVRGKDHLEQEFEPITRAIYTCYKTNDMEGLKKILDKELEPNDNDETNFYPMMKETLIELYDSYDIYPIIAYGDTDSNFIDFKITNKKTGEMPVDRWCRGMCMRLGEIESRLLKIRLPYPNNMAYEKVIHPCALMEKKNYLGKKYEDNIDEWEPMIMGFQLKRRDGSIVFQKVLGKSINMALDDIDPTNALKFMKKSLYDIIEEKYDVEDFITTKLLRAKYKGPKLTTTDEGQEDEDGMWDWYDVKKPPAHVMLCQQMKIRDPGNVPAINTRIPYVFVVKPDAKKLLVGEKIEHPDYITSNNVKIDYLYYITNQIRNPATQFFSLIYPQIQDIFDEIIIEGTDINTEYHNVNSINTATERLEKCGMLAPTNSDFNEEDNYDSFVHQVSKDHMKEKIPYIDPQKVIKKKKKIVKKKVTKRITGTKNVSVKSAIKSTLKKKKN